MASPREVSFSLILSETLNSIGYSYDTIRASQIVADLIQNKFNEQLEALDLHQFLRAFVAGSKKEGVSFFSPESDLDLMLIFQQKKFYDKPRSHRNKLLLHDVPPGYALLQSANPSGFLQANTIHDLESYVPNFENLCSHGKMVHGPIMNTETHLIPGILKSIYLITAQAFPFSFRQTGPSVEMGLDLMQNMHSATNDMVFAIPSQCSFYLDLWVKRKRPYNNLTVERIHELSKLDAHVVPVACKGTDYSHYQWRICYTMAEISLIQSFNATQYKVFVLLKMLSKEVIKSVCPQITSYMMKNVILWISELYPLEIFTENNIPNLLVFCLRFLRACVRLQFLPNYMIPRRDLLFGKWEKLADKSLISLLGELISERGMMALRCVWVQTGMKLVLSVPFASESMKISSTLQLIVYTLFLGTATAQLDIGSFCSQVTTALDIIDRISSLTERGHHVIFYIMVKKAKKVVHTLLTRDQSSRYTSTKLEVIRRVIALETKLTESVVSIMSDAARGTMATILKKMNPDMSLSDILAITNASISSEEIKKQMVSNFERTMMPYITGTPEDQKSSLQKHTQIMLQMFKRF